MADEQPETFEEVVANLDLYKQQLKDIDALLEAEPKNSEYLEVRTGLLDIIKLTEELLENMPESHQAAGGAEGAEGGAAAAAARADPASYPGLMYERPAIIENLSADVIAQMRERQGLAAIAGKGPAPWAIGLRVDAKFADDDQFYPARVVAAAPDHRFLVEFDGYGDKELVGVGSIRQHRPHDEQGYKPTQAPKRRRVEEGVPVPTEIPKHLIIKEGDDEKTIAKKKKLMKSFKKQIRFAEMDQAAKQKADSWKSFLSGKGGKGPGPKKDSIFRTSDGGKVGVTGSGRGMSQPAKKQRTTGPPGPPGAGAGDWS